jgi:hypothetical protein
MGSPLWKRGARGDFIGSFDSIGVLLKIWMTSTASLEYPKKKFLGLVVAYRS